MGLDVDAVLFDLDDTLLDGDAAWRSGMTAILRRCSGIDRDRAFSAWDVAFNEYFDAYLEGRLSLHEHRTKRIRSWAEALSIPIEPGTEHDWFDSYLAGYEAGWKPFSDVAPALHRLAHVRLGIVTNGDGQQQRAKVSALALDVNFEVIVVSGDVGYPKPDPRIFHAAAQTLGLPAERCLFIGDREDVDAMGAHNAGMQGVWLNRRGAVGQTDLDTVTTLTDLATMVCPPRSAR